MSKIQSFLTAATFSKCPFLGKTSLSVKHSCSPTFPDDKAEILAFCRSKSYELYLTINCFDFVAKSHFMIAYFLILMDYLMVNLYGSVKIKMIL